MYTVTHLSTLDDEERSYRFETLSEAMLHFRKHAASRATVWVRVDNEENNNRVAFCENFS